MKIELNAIPVEDYLSEIQQAAKEGALPAIFESTDLPDDLLEDAQDLTPITKTEQFKNCYFLDRYGTVYPNAKRMPLGIEIPMAFVITNGSVSVDYQEKLFTGINDFGNGTKIVCDPARKELIMANFPEGKFGSDLSGFFNNTENTVPVLLSSTMEINAVRTGITNYEKKYVFYDAEQIRCNFTYEWSIGSGTKEQLAAAQRLLTWMLGNAYQNSLMITNCNDGQIPVNKTCFETKINTRILSPIKDIYEKFIFS